MFNDITYLKLYVSPDEPWENLIKQLYSKKASKAEVKARIAYTVVNGRRGKISEGRGDMWLSAGHTFASYTTEDWLALYEQIKERDQEIVSIRKQLAAIPYIEPAYHAEWILFSSNYLRDIWDIGILEGYEEIKMYGINAIERMIRGRCDPFKNRRGRYHFAQALHSFAQEQGINLVELKKQDSIRFYNLLKSHDTHPEQQDSLPSRADNMQRHD